MCESFDKEKNSLGEAYCLANIIRINYEYFGNKSYDNLSTYIERFNHIIKGYDADFDWIKVIREIIEPIEKNKK